VILRGLLLRSHDKIIIALQMISKTPYLRVSIDHSLHIVVFLAHGMIVLIDLLLHEVAFL
jgi:hypothetical protein